jgi:release factor glutamine methyltransferase
MDFMSWDFVGQHEIPELVPNWQVFVDCRTAVPVLGIWTSLTAKAEPLLGMSLREHLTGAAERMGQAGVEDSASEALIIAAEILGVSRPRVSLLLESQPPKDFPARFESVVEGRIQRVPLQHLLGNAPFLDFVLQVNEGVLVPRPETEILALLAVEILRRECVAQANVLDVGTGSGCLAVHLARSIPSTSVEAIDISDAALSVAEKNCAVLCPGRIRFRQFDVLQLGLDAFRGLDMLVSNPPYIPSLEIPYLQPEVRDHDPRTALDGGPDGLVVYRHLAKVAVHWVRPGGWILLEVGDGQRDAVGELFRQSGCGVSVEKDLSGRDRVLIVRLSSASTA